MQPSRLFTQEIDFLFQQSRGTYVALTLLNILLAIAYHDNLPAFLVGVWLSATLLILVFRYWIYRRFVRTFPKEKAFYQQSYRLFFLGAIMSAILLGYGGVLLFIDGSIADQALLLFIYGGISSGAFLSLGGRREIYLAYVSLMLLPLSLRFFLSEGEMSGTISGVIAFYLLFLIFSSRNYARMIRDSLEIRIQNTDLVSELTDSKAKIETLNQKLVMKLEHSLKEIDHQREIMFQQSKLAAMGEMIGNIAHQWRQPLNLLGLKIQDVEDAYDFHEIDEAYIKCFVTESMQQISYMSKTIEDFRNFLNPVQQDETFSLHTGIQTAISLTLASFQKAGITLRTVPFNDLNIPGSLNEFVQVLVNIFNNSKDAIEQKQIPGGKIDIDVVLRESNVILTLHDNGGGIPEDIIQRIFEPYFTTKVKGTGIGLYMSYRIITEKMGGTLFVENISEGVCFIITLPVTKPATECLISNS